MKKEEWDKLSEGEKLYKVAHLCGWSWKNDHYGSGWWIHFDGRDTDNLPDYLNDLNAMHEAELMLQYRDIMLWLKYVDILRHLPFDFGGAGSEISATAPQRAYAFVRTMESMESQ